MKEANSISDVLCDFGVLAAGCVGDAHERCCTLQIEDGPVKKKRGRGGDDAEADGAPPSKGFNFGAAVPAFGAVSKGGKVSADAGKADTEVSAPPGGLSFGASQPFSFGAAAAAGTTAAEGKTDTKESQPGQENTSSSPAAALVPASLAFGARPAAAASDGELNATAKPFAPSFGARSMPSSDTGGTQQAGAGGEAGGTLSGPASNAAPGLPLIEVPRAVEFGTSAEAWPSQWA